MISHVIVPQLGVIHFTIIKIKIKMDSYNTTWILVSLYQNWFSNVPAKHFVKSWHDNKKRAPTYYILSYLDWQQMCVYPMSFSEYKSQCRNSLSFFVKCKCHGNLSCLLCSQSAVVKEPACDSPYNIFMGTDPCIHCFHSSLLISLLRREHMSMLAIQQKC